MIWDGNKVVYPSNTVINDAVNRTSYTKDAYSPITYEIRNMVDDYIAKRPDAMAYVSNWDNLCASIQEKDYSLANAMKKWSGVIDENGNFYTEKELKSFNGPVIDDILSYFKFILDRWQFQHNCFRETSTENVYASIQFHDNSGDDIYITSDEIELDDDFDEAFKEETKIEGVQRLIYYLKLLQEISIVKHYDTIQVIILSYKYGANQSAIAKAGIHTIDGEGRIRGTLAESANTTKSVADFIKLCMLMDDSPEGRRWSNIIRGFINTVKELGVDLSREDPNFYTCDYINSQLSTYLASTEEYIETIGRIDKEVLALLEPDKLFKVREGEVGYDRIFANTAMVDPIIEAYTMERDMVLYKDEVAASFGGARADIRAKYEALCTYKEDLALQFVSIIYMTKSKVKKGDKDEKGNIISDIAKYALQKVRHNYFFSQSLVLSVELESGESPVTVNFNSIRLIWPKCQFNGICYVTISGALIFIDQHSKVPSYITIEELLRGEQPEAKKL